MAQLRRSGRPLALWLILASLAVAAGVWFFVNARFSDLDAGSTETCRLQAVEIEELLVLHHRTHGVRPSLLSDLLTGTDAHPATVERVPADPWRRPYILLDDGEGTRKRFRVVSGGPDGEVGTEDDCGNWR